MTLQLRPNLTSIIAGTIATAAILTQAPQASARIATASIVAMGNSADQTEAVNHSANEPCEQPEDGTILSDATESLAALGRNSPITQASALIAGVSFLAGGSLLLKSTCQ